MIVGSISIRMSAIVAEIHPHMLFTPHLHLLNMFPASSQKPSLTHRVGRHLGKMCTRFCFLKGSNSGKPHVAGLVSMRVYCQLYFEPKKKTKGQEFRGLLYVFSFFEFVFFLFTKTY